MCLLFLQIFFYVAFLHVFFFFVSDAAGIEFDRGALEHGSALDDATVAVEDRCSTVVNSDRKSTRLNSSHAR